MKKAFLILALFVLCPATYAQDDLVIKKTTDMKIPGMPDMGDLLSKNGGSRGEGIRKSRTSTVMVKGSRLRVDSNIPTIKDMGLSTGSREISYIQQCDLMRTVHLNPKKKSYAISNIAGSGPAKGKTAEKIQKAKKGGYVDVSIEVTDTNERKNMFGFVAKHLRSTTTMTPSSNACNKQPMTFQDDGWYVDLPTYACEIQTEDTMNSMQETAQDCVDEIRVKSGTNMHLGFALQQTRTMSMNGMTFQMIENVVSLDRLALDAALFEIPADYHPSSDSDSVASDVSPVQPPPPTTSPNAPPQTPPNMQPNGTAYPTDWQNKPLPQMVQMTDADVPRKAPGVIRIGVVTPTADMGQGFEGVDAGQIIQSAFLDMLKGDKIEAVPISSAVLIEQQAKMKQCDYLLYVDLKRKKGGGGFLKQMLLTNIACMGGNAACASASAASGAASMSGRLKNKDEITLEYHVDKAGGVSAVASTSLKKKAQKDGDDVVSSLIDEAATGIVNSVRSK